MRKPEAMPLIDRWMPRAIRSSVSASPVALEQFDLQVVQRVHVRRAQLERVTQHRVVGEQFVLFLDGQQVLAGQIPFGPDAAEDAFAQLGIGDQFGVARGDGEVGLGQHHVHVGEQVRKNGQDFSMRRSVPGRPDALRQITSTAEPKPYQPGSIRRHCAQLKTQGMARRSSMRSEALREAGRLPMLSEAISETTVDWRK